MKKALKWIGILLGGLVGLIILAVVILSSSADARLNKAYAIQPAAVVISMDNASINLRLPRFRQRQPNMVITWSRPSAAAPAMARNWRVVKIPTQTRHQVPT
jgi:hypothetical protein